MADPTTYRILMVLDKLNVGGTETHVLAITQELLRKGTHVVICADNGKLYDKFVELGCPIYLIQSHYIDDGQQINQALQDIIRRESINFIHAHQEVLGKYALAVAEKLNLPFFFTVHGKYYSRSFLQKVVNYPNARVISVSIPIQKWLHEKEIPSSIIPNGIDTQTYRDSHGGIELRKQLGIGTNDLVIVYASRLAFGKEAICKDVIKACARLKESYPKLKLIIAGDGLHVKSPEAAARKYDKNNNYILFIGEQLDMRKVYTAGDIVVGTGRVALEAMACRRPVVAVGVAGLCGVLKPSMLDKGWNRYYFGDHLALQQSSSRSIRHALIPLLESSSRRSYYGSQGRQFVKENFNIGRVTNELLSFYQKIIDKNLDKNLDKNSKESSTQFQ
jgi:L-malate glycosyltransferase